MKENFQPGDVVILKSGGPQMTIAATRGEGLVLCVWFKDDEIKREAIEAKALSKES